MKSDLIAPLAIPVLLLLAQCSPVAPPLARGSAHFRSKRPSDFEPGTQCTDSYGGIGNPPPEVPISALSEADLHLDGLVVDGEQSSQANVPYEISCKISGNGDLTISGKLEGPNTSPFLANHGSSTSLEIKDGIIHAGTGTGTGLVSFFTTATLAVSPKENTRCTLTATPTPLKACSNLSCLSGETPGDYGSMAITFFCPDMNMGAAGIASDCEADGTVVLDRCTY